jgi:hypothetical protein
MLRRLTRTVAVGTAALCFGGCIAATAPAGASVGDLFQLGSTAGCVEEPPLDVSEGCASGNGLADAAAVATSPDNKNVYAVSGHSLAVFSRGSAGELTQLAGTAGCLNEGGTDGCGTAKLGGVPDDVVVSPDGNDVYVSAGAMLAAFSRDTSTGALTQLSGTDACVSQDGSATSGGPTTACNVVRGHANAVFHWLSFSSDGTSLYSGGPDLNSLVSVFKRANNGTLSQPAGAAACVSYNSLDGDGGACAGGSAVENSNSLAVSPDGNFAYISSSHEDSVDIFARDGTTGGLTEITGPGQCVKDADSTLAPTCTSVRALAGTRRLVLSPGDSGASLYVAAHDSGGGAVAEFTRDTTTGKLSQGAHTAGCVSQSGSDGESSADTCLHGWGLQGATWPAMSPTGTEVYVTAPDANAIAVLPRAANHVLSENSCVGETTASGTGGSLPCIDDRALGSALSVAVAADGANVYSASPGSDAVDAFERQTPGPLVGTTAATDVHETSATLNGSANPQGALTSARFDWGTTTSYGNVTPYQTAGSDNAGHAISQVVLDLLPNRTYHYRIEATNVNGTHYGNDVTFTTGSVKPTVFAHAKDFTRTSVTAEGVVNPEGLDTSVYVTLHKQGTGEQVAQTNPATVSGDYSSHTVDFPLTGLTPLQGYFVVVHATNPTGETDDSASFFVPDAPVVRNPGVVEVRNNSATVSAHVDPNAVDTLTHVDFGKTSSYGQHTPAVDIGGADGDHLVKQTLTGLKADTTYHFQFVAVNGIGNGGSIDSAFTTSSVGKVPLKLGGGGLKAAVPCLAARTCVGQITIATTGGSGKVAAAAAAKPVVLGKASFRVKPHKKGVVLVHLTKAGRKQRKHLRHRTVVETVKVHAAHSKPVTTTAKVKVG